MTQADSAASLGALTFRREDDLTSLSSLMKA
jgi:hypothetical protein